MMIISGVFILTPANVIAASYILYEYYFEKEYTEGF